MDMSALDLSEFRSIDNGSNNGYKPMDLNGLTSTDNGY